MRRISITAALAAGGLALTIMNLAAQDQPMPAPQAQSGKDAPTLQLHHSEPVPACQAASHLIGMQVVSQTGDRLGKVQDLILSLDSDRAPFAVIRCGGVLGMGGTRVAVPLNELKLSIDNTSLTLAATRDQLASASSTPEGGWARIADQDWTKRIDRFYGQPPEMGTFAFERQGMEPAKEGHEFVRTPEEQKGANDLVNQAPAQTASPREQAAKPEDSEITAQVNRLVEQSLGAQGRQDIQVTVEKGVVRLSGKVPTGEGQRSLDDQIKGLKGVGRVDDQLTVSTKQD